MSSILGLGIRAGRAAAGGGDVAALVGPGIFGGSALFEAVNVLRGADAELDASGWTQGALGMLSDGERCLLGAVDAAGQR